MEENKEKNGTQAGNNGGGNTQSSGTLENKKVENSGTESNEANQGKGKPDITDSEVQEGFIYNPVGRTNLRNITKAGLSFILENTTGKRGEIFIPPGQARIVPNEEILIKIEAQNPSVCGTDGCGSNAALVIEDEAWREYLGFNKGGAQKILTDEVVESIFAAKTVEEFKRLTNKHIKTQLEKEKLMIFLREKHKQGKFDSETKIKFIEKFTGLPMEAGI